MNTDYHSYKLKYLFFLNKNKYYVLLNFRMRVFCDGGTLFFALAIPTDSLVHCTNLGDWYSLHTHTFHL